MNKYFLITFSILPLLVIAGVLALNFWGRDYGPPPKAEGTEKELALYLEVREILLERYDGELEGTKLLDGALSGMTAAPGDRYTHINVPLEAQAQREQLQGHFYGIGVLVRGNTDGSILVRGVYSDGPAGKAGLRDNDVIVAVDGASCLDQPFEATQRRIRGERNTSVVITVLRGGKPDNGRDAHAEKLDFSITRGEVTSYSVHNARIEEREGRKFGYVRVSDFHDNTFDPQLKDAIELLTRGGAEGLVLDLRQNGGGKVRVAEAMIDAFLEQKNALMVFTRSNNEKNRKDDRESRTQDDQAITRLPLVLLVDRGSASATEIVTGALKDHGRALVVGERTFGKGVVQSILYLRTDPRYSLNVTTTQYYTPLGRRVQKGSKGEPGGIRPHVEIPYRDEDEYRLIVTKLELQESRLSSGALLETEAQRKAWNAEDRMLNAALSLLAGKAVNVKD